MNLWDWLFRRHQREEELDEEVQSHLRMAAQERMEQGESAEQARTSAVREFGNVTLVKEVTRDMWGYRSLETLLQDVSYGLRQLRKNPGFTVVAVLTLALGIGGNTAMFSVINAVLLRPLPYKGSHQLVEIFSSNSMLSKDTISPLAYFEIKHRTNVFQDLALYSGWYAKLTGPGDPERAVIEEVSSDVFRLLDVRPPYWDEPSLPRKPNRGEIMSP
jgi:hypothetical protein